MNVSTVPGFRTVPTTVYAGGAGVFKSADGGVTWTTIGSGLGCVLSLAIDPTDPTIIYAGTDVGAFKTTDGGGHWNPIDNGIVLVSGNPPWHSAVTAIVIDPTNAATVYAATGRWGNGVFKSTNGGASWTAINNGLVTNANLDVRAMVMDPSDPNTLYVTGVTGLLSAKTIDGGATWTTLPVMAFGYAAVVHPVQTSTVYIAGPSGISKTVDGGATWSQIVNGLTNMFVFSLAIDPSAPETVYAGTGGNVVPGVIFKTTDGGAIWFEPGGGMAGSEIVFALAVDRANPATIYAGSSQGVLKSTNGGVSWNTSLAAPGIQTLAMQHVTAQALLQDLIGDVHRLASATGPLSFRQANALVQKLQKALNAVNQKGNAKLARGDLAAFLKQARALVQSGHLTAAQGAALTALAQAIMRSIPRT